METPIRNAHPMHKYVRRALGWLPGLLMQSHGLKQPAKPVKCLFLNDSIQTLPSVSVVRLQIEMGENKVQKVLFYSVKNTCAEFVTITELAFTA